MSTATTATTQPVNVVDTEKGDENNTHFILHFVCLLCSLEAYANPNIKPVHLIKNSAG